MTTATVALPDVFSALGDPTRWEILTRLGSAPQSASKLATHLPVTRQAISQHLEVLRDANLVQAQRVGREVRYQVRQDTVSDAATRLAAIAASWQRSLEALRRAAEAEVAEVAQAGPPNM